MSVSFYSPFFTRLPNNCSSANPNKNNILSLFDEEFWNNQVNKQSTPKEWSPKSDYQLDEENVIIQFELPGLKKDQINIDIKDSTLTISGEKKESFYEVEPSSPLSSSTTDISSNNEDTPRIEEDVDENQSPQSKESTKSIATEESKKSTTDDVKSNSDSKATKKRLIIKREIVYGRFKRIFQLPKDIDLESASAKHEDGILTFTIKRVQPEPLKSTKIQIQ
ncbi:hypothetical protein PPL_04183 [Heterostelium album PN500]|uniref:SHSP domain-containing protein n=1 Tax=Heterostelium pallidum (strain ATCC 26659 / Pp 5 / PN500) TaxID=670386 RepID=D3B692_HETP5|nr:hypothetical protein PPL_04183 [Heterostelium album PN500]EFA83390.1 hypothetical protein PPL_04183 [Heterostelium album PN500]|eukprot:XP_020435507.1 hypothetical protein PPL_04183 [Heterostelium album PN500]